LTHGLTRNLALARPPDKAANSLSARAVINVHACLHILPWRQNFAPKPSECSARIIRASEEVVSNARQAEVAAKVTEGSLREQGELARKVCYPNSAREGAVSLNTCTVSDRVIAWRFRLSAAAADSSTSAEFCCVT